jgi:hypothetical protein
MARHGTGPGRLIRAAGLSLVLYAAAFGLLLDRPLSLGFLQAQIEAKLARARSIQGRKLVILAGSNGPYSHRCEIIEPISGIPCVNGGVAVGIGLDYLFARWKPLLHPGDLVYLPMEEAQYIRPRSAIRLGPDAAIMLRHDRETLLALPPDRWLSAFFSGDVRTAAMSLVETVLIAAGFRDPRAGVTGSMNAWGDHIGHTQALGAVNAPLIARLSPDHPAASAVRAGDGSAEIARFLGWAREHGVEAVGGFPTGFSDSPIPPETRDAILRIYTANKARFLELPNESRYPRSDFFDTADHLDETGQIAHSRLVARALTGSVAQADAGVTGSR